MNLLLLLALQADVADLIRGLGSDAAETRAEAARRLSDLGPAAAPALRKAAAEGDAEVRSLAADLLERIARRERVGVLGGLRGRATVALKNVPFAEAVERTLSAFGPVDLPADPALAGRAVSVALDRAAYWEAVEELERTGAAGLSLEDGRWMPGVAAAARRSGTGDVRVIAGGWRSQAEAGDDARPMLYVEVWLAPGLWAPEMAGADVAVIDDRGRAVPAELVVDASGHRRPGRPNRMGVGGVALDAARAQGAKAFTIRGTVVAAFPRDVERVLAPAAAMPAVARMAGGGEVRIDRLDVAASGRWAYEVSSRGGTEDFDYLLALEDADGAWLGDLRADGQRAEGRRSASGDMEALRARPSRMAVYRAIGLEKMRIPFVLPAVPAP
jgi:hypothetical protein